MNRLALAVIVFMWGVPSLVAAPDGENLHIKLDSPESLREVYETLGFVFDDAESEARREELDRECLVKGSRRFGRIPRPIKFLGLAYNVADEQKELFPICMALRPYPDRAATRLCKTLGRELVENRIMNMEIVCGPKAS